MTSGDRRSSNQGRPTISAATLVLSTILASGGLSVSALAQSPQSPQSPQLPQAAAQQTLPGFSIPPQSLTDGLAQFGQQSGWQVSVPGDLIRGSVTPGVHGRMTPPQALDRLLAGTGFTYSISDGSTVTLQKVTATTNGAMALPPVEIEGLSQTGVGPFTGTDRVDNPQQVSASSKTGTPLADMPASVQIIPRALLSEQGANMLRDSVYNASGVNFGGQDSKGFYDHFEIRGLNAQIYEDGFSDGDLLGGISHSLNGVENIEILEGPGSALFGSGPPGGTINILHYTPSPDFHYGGNIQGGSFGTIANNEYITGPTTLPGLNYRIDATFDHSNGFRDLGSHDYEVRPALEWQLGNHTVDFALDLRQIDETPDSYGIIYFNGSPLKDVSINAKFSTPFAYSHETFVRPTLTDRWVVNDFLTINNRFSYLHRLLDTLGNGDSTSTKISADEVVGRQLRSQNDTDGSFDYQFEPVWTFPTGPVHHTLLTGFEYVHQTIDTNRSTADLPNILDAFNPVPPETSLSTLNFLCDAKHSCDNDNLAANYYSLYATDQMDVTDKLKVRAGIRQDWFDTSLTPQITVPGRFGTNGQPLVAGVTDTRDDAPVSWNLGVLYKLTPWISPYIGVSESHLANFNSESTQNGIGAPEAARQYEAGIKFSFLNDRIVMNTAVFNISRNNVATLVTINGIEDVVFDAQRTRGAEASWDTQITRQWHLLANVTAQDAVVTDNPQGVTSVGNHPQGVPAYLANLWTTYDFSIGNVSGFRVGGGLNYQAKSYSDITNVNSIPSFVIANAVVGYETPKWGIDLNLHNITNQRYFVAANAAGALVGESFSALVNLHANL
jgi:iron complex outermembrane recepter protein